LLELLFAYQQSVYYRLHLVALFLVGVTFVFVFREERRLMKLEDERPISKCSNTVPYFDYVTTKQKTTQEALE
jgi:uncharacterized membrane protein YcjF (UPF0283 family)